MSYGLLIDSFVLSGKDHALVISRQELKEIQVSAEEEIFIS